MDRLNSWLRFLAVSACAVGLTGCPGNSSLTTEPVEGVVTVDGTPVPEATVMFVPVTEGQGTPATGMTDANGVYKLTAAISGETTAVPQGGTTPGEYYVGVVKTNIESPMGEEEAQAKGIPYVAPDSYAPPKATYVVPQKYNDPKLSGLKVTVKEGENNIPLELTAN